MNGYEILDGVKLNSFIGEGTKFKGEFELEGLLRIDGDFTGTIRTKGRVLINGRAECNINAGKVVIGGIVKGNIVASECVEILSSGMVIGDITAPGLIIEEGVVFCGNCKVFDSEKLKENKINLKQENGTESVEENNYIENSANTKNKITENSLTSDKKLVEKTGIYENYLKDEKKENNNEQIKNNQKLYIENKY